MPKMITQYGGCGCLLAHLQKYALNFDKIDNTFVMPTCEVEAKLMF